MKRLRYEGLGGKEISQFSNIIIEEDEGQQYYHMFCALQMGNFRDLVNMKDFKLLK